MDKQPLRSSRLKVERANHHINDLDWKISAFRKRKPYRLVIENDPDPEFCMLVVRVKHDMPSDFAMIIGDAIHNLRAALDLLACDLVRYNGGDIEQVYFPICKSEDELEDTIKKRRINLASPQVIDVIRSLKPYTGGNIPLRALHDLDIADKHTTLIPVTTITSIPNFTATRNGVPTITMQDCGIMNPVEGAGIISFLMPDNYKIGHSFKPIFDLTFGNGQPFEREPIVPTLKQLSTMVNDIIDGFSRMYRPIH